MKYTTVKISGVITQVAEELSPGYTEGLLESFLPETKGWSQNKINSWIKQNNKRMEAICKFLNENNL